MKPIILCLSGWAQKPESLQAIFDDQKKLSFNQFQIINFDYSQFCSVEECFLALKDLKINPQIIVGWSLGGQIACRLIAENIFNPRLLILISAPFQFVKSPKISAGMPKMVFDVFCSNFAKNSAKTLEKFSVLMMMSNVKRAKELAQNLEINDQNYPSLVFWLSELGRFSCYDLDFYNFPKTLIFHGAGDVVVNVAQAKIFADKIKDSKLTIFPDCGHCPHISNLEEMKKVINNFLI